MRILPRLTTPRIRQVTRQLKRLRRYLSVSRVVLMVEVTFYLATLLFVFTGSRAEWIDRHNKRFDGLVLLGAFVLFVAMHAVTTRRIVPYIRSRISPPEYDERRILFDLGQEARAATNIEQLYQSLVNQIRAALQAETVAIFVREDDSGDFVRRISTGVKLDRKRVTSDDGGETITEAKLVLARDAFVIKRVQHLSTPMPIAPEEYEAWKKALATFPAAVREARDRESATLQKIKARLLVQITVKGQLVGLLALGPRRNGFLYSERDVEMLMSVAGQIALVIENAKLIDRIVAEERLRRDLVLAADVQKRLFPEAPPTSSTVELAGYCQPARGIGGDYYDFLSFDNQRIGVAIADVAGKGISAALVMSSVQASLRSQAFIHKAGQQEKGAVQTMVSALNQLLCQSTGSATYVTFFYAEFDDATRQLTYINAGHNPPIIIPVSRKEERVAGAMKLTNGGPVIGMFDFSSYEEETIQLRSGDVLVAFTDGVSEALDRLGEEYGEERLQEVAQAVAHLSAREIREAIIQDVQAWCDGAAQHDDLTFVVMKVK